MENKKNMIRKIVIKRLIMSLFILFLIIIASHCGASDSQQSSPQKKLDTQTQSNKNVSLIRLSINKQKQQLYPTKKRLSLLSKSLTHYQFLNSSLQNIILLTIDSWNPIYSKHKFWVQTIIKLAIEYFFNNNFSTETITSLQILYNFLNQKLKFFQPLFLLKNLEFLSSFFIPNYKPFQQIVKKIRQDIKQEWSSADQTIYSKILSKTYNYLKNSLKKKCLNEKNKEKQKRIQDLIKLIEQKKKNTPFTYKVRSFVYFNYFVYVFQQQRNEKIINFNCLNLQKIAKKGLIKYMQQDKFQYRQILQDQILQGKKYTIDTLKRKTSSLNIQMLQQVFKKQNEAQKSQNLADQHFVIDQPPAKKSKQILLKNKIQQSSLRQKQLLLDKKVSNNNQYSKANLLIKKMRLSLEQWQPKDKQNKKWVLQIMNIASLYYLNQNTTENTQLLLEDIFVFLDTKLRYLQPLHLLANLNFLSSFFPQNYLPYIQQIKNWKRFVATKQDYNTITIYKKKFYKRYDTLKRRLKQQINVQLVQGKKQIIKNIINLIEQVTKIKSIDLKMKMYIYFVFMVFMLQKHSLQYIQDHCMQTYLILLQKGVTSFLQTYQIRFRKEGQIGFMQNQQKMFDSVSQNNNKTKQLTLINPDLQSQKKLQQVSKRKYVQTINPQSATFHSVGFIESNPSQKQTYSYKNKHKRKRQKLQIQFSQPKTRQLPQTENSQQIITHQIQVQRIIPSSITILPQSQYPSNVNQTTLMNTLLSADQTDIIPFIDQNQQQKIELPSIQKQVLALLENQNQFLFSSMSFNEYKQHNYYHLIDQNKSPSTQQKFIITNLTDANITFQTNVPWYKQKEFVQQNFQQLQQLPFKNYASKQQFLQALLQTIQTTQQQLQQINNQTKLSKHQK